MADENTTPEVQDVKVDESSIARPDIARRNTLDKQLAHRPDRAELIESEPPPFSHILLFVPSPICLCL